MPVDAIRSTPNDSWIGLPIRWFKSMLRWLWQLQHKDSHVTARLTREGFQFVFIALFVLVGAVIRDVNLLIILAGTLLGMLLLQWRVCTRTLYHVVVDRRLPRSMHARKPFEIELSLRNTKSWLGAWLVLAQDRMVYSASQPQSSTPSQGIGLLYNAIPPRTTRAQRYRCIIDRRGTYQFMGTELSTRFPFGLMRGIIYSRDEKSFVVQPAVGRLLPSWFELFNVRSSGQKLKKSHALSDEGDFFGLRAYRPGDSPRWIHWRSSARRDELVVRQFQRSENRELVVLLDLFQPKGQGKLTPTNIEDLAVEFVATLATQMVHTNLGYISVAIADSNPGLACRVQSRSQCSGLLDRLAVAVSAIDNELPASLMILEKEHPRVDHLVVISTRPRLKQFDDKASVTEISSVFWRSCTWLDVSNGDITKYFVPAE